MKIKKAIGCVVIALGVSAAVIYHNQPYALSQAKPSLPPLPEQEQSFVDEIAQGFQEYASAQNDFIRGAARVHRAQALCAQRIPGRVEGWVGTVEKLSSNSSGFGVLTVRIADHVTVSTTNNEFSDGVGGFSTLIRPNDPVYAQLSHLHEGAAVVFSGLLAPSDTDCFAEDSVTQEGSMTDPQFYMRFTSVQEIPVPQ